jgi:AbrB family looped-hinge helix DNA binding protein
MKLRSTLTERGQISIPAKLRKEMNLKPGQKLRWERISGTAVRLVVEGNERPDPFAVLGLGPSIRGEPARSTEEWMRELRAGDED